MTITYHEDVVQGSDEWRAVRCGLLTASEMRLIITPTLKVASNEKEKTHLFELLAQRVNNYVEPAYIGYDMLRGQSEEIEAKIAYAEHYAPVTDIGFITNDRWGFTIGYSPDGLVEEDNGQLECKSRRQAFQIQTLVECVAEEVMPAEYALQVQTGLLVSERKWCDFISYSGGLPMATIRVYPDPIIQEAIVAAAWAFEQRLAEKWDKLREVMASKARLLPTERKIETEMYV